MTMTEELKKQFEEKGADWNWTQELLARLNQGLLLPTTANILDFPRIDGRKIIDLQHEQDFFLDRHQVECYFPVYFPQLRLKDYLRPAERGYFLSQHKAQELGLILSQRTAIGILNGGMATSYTDIKKNQSLDAELFRIYEREFKTFSDSCQGLPKGITPAFIQNNTMLGPSYIELKLRHIKLMNLAARMQKIDGPGLKLFQMTSQNTHNQLIRALSEFEKSPFLTDLLDASSWKLSASPSEIQPLIGTFTPQDINGKRTLFTTMRNGKHEAYLLPGGHGQNFYVLKNIYQNLAREGYLFIYIGNVDNLGFLASLKGLTLLALSGAPAAFDFSFKTPVDIKGGILYRTPEGQLSCGDIGVNISSAQIEKAEQEKNLLFFNCATGLFHLPKLLDNLDRIIADLPIRFFEQDKDIGRYMQIEQITWEVIGLLDHPLIFIIEKSQRFLAAKLLMDCLLTSGLRLDDTRFQTETLHPFYCQAMRLNAGLKRLLEGPYAMKRNDKDHWVAASRHEVESRLAHEGFRFLAV